MTDFSLDEIERRLRAVPRLLHDDGDLVVPDYPALARLVAGLLDAVTPRLEQMTDEERDEAIRRTEEIVIERKPRFVVEANDRFGMPPWVIVDRDGGHAEDVAWCFPEGWAQMIARLLNAGNRDALPLSRLDRNDPRVHVFRLLADGVISVGKACEALNDIAAGQAPQLPDVVPSDEDTTSWRQRAERAEAALARVWSELHDFELEPGTAAWEALDVDTIARVLAIVEPPRTAPEGT